MVNSRSRRTFLQAAATIAAARSLSAQDTAQNSQESIKLAIFNRDRKWLALESEATLERTFQIDTPLGKSPVVRQLRYQGTPFYYIPRYGDAGSGEITRLFDETFPGERLVQIWVTFMQLGVNYVIHGNIIGGVHSDLSLNDLVIVDDFIDLKPNHPQSITPYFYKGKPPEMWPEAGVRMFPVMCPVARRALYDKALLHHFAKVKLGGTLIQTRSARWETPAEIRMLRLLGADVACTLDASSIVYAKQAGIHFATGQYIMNFGEGSRPMEAATTSESGFERIATSMRKTFLDTLKALPSGPPKCDCFRPRA